MEIALACAGKNCLYDSSPFDWFGMEPILFNIILVLYYFTGPISKAGFLYVLTGPI
jgi:hypothetical protein